MGSMDIPQLPRPWVETPLIESAPLSKVAGCRIFCKLENLQPSGSFKSRGIGNLILRHIQSRPPFTPLHFYSSSGGNAGLACVTAARTLGYPATVVVPLSTNPFMIPKIKAAGATEVLQLGASWFEADLYLRETLLPMDPHGVYVPPFDDERIWEGNAELVREVKKQMGGERPDVVICSVGGGGLFSGIVRGLDEEFWEEKVQKRVSVLAVETEGADSLSVSLGNGMNTTLPKITSIATSLGARKVAEKAFECGMRAEVKSLVLTDADAAMGCWRFADDERMVVEPACGVSLAAIYNGSLRKKMPWLTKESKVVVVVCGGSNVTLELLEEYRKKYGIVDAEEMKDKKLPIYVTAH